MAEAISSSSSVVLGTVAAALARVQAPSPQISSQAAAAAAPAAVAAGLAATDASTRAQKIAGSADPGHGPAWQQAVKSLQDYIKPQEAITLQVDEGSGQTYVKIVNARTKQLVLQIPSAQVLSMARNLQEMASPQAASGLLVNQQG